MNPYIVTYIIGALCTALAIALHDSTQPNYRDTFKLSEGLLTIVLWPAVLPIMAYLYLRSKFWI